MLFLPPEVSHPSGERVVVIDVIVVTTTTADENVSDGNIR